MNARRSLRSAAVADGSAQGALPRGAVSFEQVCKRFRKRQRTQKSYSTVKSSVLSRLLGRGQGQAPFLEALSDVSLQIPPGSALGVIGRNGSGKSTLLKLIAGIYLPDQGKVRVHGRISALIELGAGFHPDFTGRENVYLGGIMYGLSRREIDERFASILKYSELEEFIDDPVRTYSSGMYMRLGFSLAVHTDPDILLIDEVLAVGDAGFINRCHDTISEFKRQGKTLIFVTHDLGSVARWCDEAVWIDRGRIREQGEPRRVIDAYLEDVEESDETKLAAANLEQPAGSESTDNRWGSREVELTEVRMLDRQGQARWLFHDNEEATVEVSYTIHAPLDDLVFGIGIIRADGTAVHGTNTELDRIEAPLPGSSISAGYPVKGTYRYCIKRLGLLEDSYYLDVAAHRSDGYPYDYHHRLHKFSVRNAARFTGIFNPEHAWEFAPGYEVEQLSADGRRARIP